MNPYQPTITPSPEETETIKRQINKTVNKSHPVTLEVYINNLKIKKESYYNQ